MIWKSQVSPLVRSLVLLHHFTNDNPSKETIFRDDGNKNLDPKIGSWLNIDSLLTSWFAKEILLIMMILSLHTRYVFLRDTKMGILSVFIINRMK